MGCYVNQDTIAQKTEQWLEQIAKFNTHTMSLNQRRAALLVIDMQTFFLDPQSPSFTCGGHAIIANVRNLITEFRQAGRPVIFTRHVHHPAGLDAGIMGWWWQGMCLEGSPDSEIYPELAPRPDEKVILKHRYSAFYNTDLETVLRCLKIEDLVVTGVMTNLCCESTARDAYFRDHRIFFLADGTGSITEQLHIASLLNVAFGFAWVTDHRTIIAHLRDGERRPSPDQG